MQNEQKNTAGSVEKGSVIEAGVKVVHTLEEDAGLLG